MKISDLLDAVEDDSVAIREKEIIASERIREVTMAKIHADAAFDSAARKRLSRGAIAVIAAAAVLALSVTAYATGIVSRVVNWQGETIGEAEEVAVTPPPADSGEMERFERTRAILDAADGDELVLVKYTGENGAMGTKSGGMTQSFSSAEDLRAALDGAASELRIFDAPAGYAFVSAQLSYDCAAGYEYELISSETENGGLTVERYAVPDRGTVISSYLIDYMDGDGHSMLITGMLTDVDVEFTIGEDETVRSIPVDGMDSALVMEQTDVYGVVSASLQMSKALSTPIAYVNRSLLSGAHPTEGGDIFNKAWYSVCAYGLDADTLLEMMGF